MLSRQELPSLSSFALYPLNKIQSLSEYHYLKISPDELWMMPIRDTSSLKAKARIWNNGQLREKPLEERQIDLFKRKLLEMEARKKQQTERLIQVKCPLKDAQRVNFASREAVTVLQHEYAMTSHDAAQPIVGSFGAGPCIILALYDSTNKRAVLAHIDTLTDFENFTAVLLTGLDKTATTAHLFGGDKESIELCHKVINFIDESQISIANADVVRISTDTASLAIDARNGAIYSPVEAYQLDQPEDIFVRYQSAIFASGISPLREYKSKINNRDFVEGFRDCEEKKEDENLILTSKFNGSDSPPRTRFFENSVTASGESDYQQKEFTNPTVGMS